MKLNIIHGNREERLPILFNELQSNGITDYKIWHGEFDKTSVIKAISQSHKKIIQYAKDNLLPEICIAEDDLKFTCNDSFNYFLKNKPTDYDIYLGGCYAPKFNSDNTIYSFSALHLYIVNERFYDTILATPNELHLDRAISGLGKFILCSPMVAVQHNGFSQNTGKNENYDNVIPENFLYFR